MMVSGLMVNDGEWESNFGLMGVVMKASGLKIVPLAKEY